MLEKSFLWHRHFQDSFTSTKHLGLFSTMEVHTQPGKCEEGSNGLCMAAMPESCSVSVSPADVLEVSLPGIFDIFFTRLSRAYLSFRVKWCYFYEYCPTVLQKLHDLLSGQTQSGPRFTYAPHRDQHDPSTGKLVSKCGLLLSNLNHRNQCKEPLVLKTICVGRISLEKGTQSLPTTEHKNPSGSKKQDHIRLRSKQRLWQREENPEDSEGCEKEQAPGWPH